jgi:hypothetical protein
MSLNPVWTYIGGDDRHRAILERGQGIKNYHQDTCCYSHSVFPLVTTRPIQTGYSLATAVTVIVIIGVTEELLSTLLVNPKNGMTDRHSSPGLHLNSRLPWMTNIRASSPRIPKIARPTMRMITKGVRSLGRTLKLSAIAPI